MSMKSVSFSPAAFGDMRRSTAMRKEVTATPLGVYFSSGSVASRPIRITLFSISSPFHSSHTTPALIPNRVGPLHPTLRLTRSPSVRFTPLSREGLLLVRSDNQMSQNPFGDAQDAAQLGLRLRLATEVHDDIDALTLAFDLVGQSTPLPFVHGI